MTAHTVTPGSQNTFGVFNGYAPKQGPKALPVTLDFSNDSQVTVDFTEAEQSNGISFVQSVFVDNSQNPNPLNLTFNITGQKIVCPAFAQSVFPVICTQKSNCVATTNPGVIINTIFLNVPMASEMWGPITVNVAAVNLVPVMGIYTDDSGTIAVSNVSQQVLAVNPNRKRFVIENPSANIESLFFNFTNAASATIVGSIELTPGGSYDSASGPVTTEAVNIAALTVGHTFVVKEM